ncbi:9e8016d4-0dd3-4ae3-af2d-b2f82353f430 [Thermothielavioides terrestris]|uniref:9e8016d4-0dd3-4ae3-af2d-b2f82353f430 n=1 Tax=Thermothielavioides terrestris TaxID=2587410 RepID=A0A446BSS3_9PEZI|nr:9e8016d4-0dd3-4ae3-af2d-b2f82353f430 [Thermothielavioides terrestris]
MSGNTVYLITGANRGLGLAMTTLLLARPHTTVIATSRKPADSLTALSTARSSSSSTIHPTSRLIPLLLDEADDAISSATLPARLAAATTAAAAGGSSSSGPPLRLDVVIANAGSSAAFRDVLGTDPGADMVRDFEVNAVGPAKLFRAVWPLLERASAAGTAEGQGEGEGHNKQAGKEEGKEVGGVGKFVLVSSSLGSIGLLDQESLPGVAYGMSKAAANWWAKKTELGQALADAVGFKEPPMTLEQSAKGMIQQIDNLTPEKSGQFLQYNGDQLPW